MQKYTTILALSAALVLAACDGKPSTSTAASQTAETTSSVSTASNVTTPAASAVAPSGVVTLSSKDGKITINTSGTFTDKFNDATFLPIDAKADDVLLLQYDESRNLTVYAVQAGQVKKSAENFFANLKKTIETDKNITNAHVSEVANNQISYDYSTTGEPVSHESCVIAVGADKGITTVCAVSSDLSVDEVKAVLADVKFGS